MASKALFRSRDLGGGFQLHLHRTRAFKTITARLIFHANLDEGTAARALVPRILARGTRRLPSLRDVQVELDRLYGASLAGDARKVGERQLVQFRADWIADRLAGEPLLEKMASLLAEYLREPAGDNGDAGLRASVVTQERKNMEDEVAAVFDDKSRYARRRLVETMCRNEAYSRPATGRIEEVRALEPDAVSAAWQGLIDRAPADLFLVGDITWRDAERFAKKLGLHRHRKPARIRATRRVKPGRVRTVREAQDVGQAKLEMGFRTTSRFGSASEPAFVLMNALFGGTPVSKLFKKVREEASLCYSVHSVSERTKGLVLVHAGIDEANYQKARRLILKQLESLQRGEIATDELEMARGILLSSLRGMHDSPYALTGFAIEHAANGIAADLDGFMERMARVTRGQVARAARTVSLDTVFLLRS